MMITSNSIIEYQDDLIFAACEFRWSKGDKFALIEAIAICAANDLQYPKWVRSQINLAMTGIFEAVFRDQNLTNGRPGLGIYAVSPLIAALLAWSVIGEKVSSRTMVGCVGALLGVALIVSGSLGQISLNGDLLALWMSTVMALIMVVYRKYPDTPGAGPAVLSSVILLPFAAILGNPFDVERTEIYVLSAFGLLFAIASVTLAEGSKRVPSGQTALLSNLETPIAPVLAFIFFTEIPNIETFLGGSVVLFAVLFSIRNGTKLPGSPQRKL